MSLTIISKDEFNHFVNHLLPRYRVAGPVASNGGHAFEAIQDAADLRLDYRTTILPPKKYLLPPREVLFQFNLDNHGWVQMVEEAEPTVLVGVHTCDLHAIQLLNRVFNSGHQDPYYANRSQNTLIVSLECLTPCDEHSFCKSMGTLTADEGYDLHLTDLGEAYAVDIGTTAGNDLLQQFARSRTAEPDEISRLNAVISDKWPRFPYRLDFDVSDLPSLLSMSMKSPLWAELGERCLACAACTNVCPTCYCFDVTDDIELSFNQGIRYRIWNSCQMDDFAKVATGEDFRKGRDSRQRHRYYRKFKYPVDKYNRYFCTGCGRCSRTCMADIVLIETVNSILDPQNAGRYIGSVKNKK